MKKNYGLIAAFDTVPQLYHACEQVRDAGYSQWDALTSFPIHGLDYAMGVRRSKVPRFSLAGGLTGFCTGMSFIAWYGANPYEGFAFINRAFGHYAWAYWIMISCNVITPQFFWFKSVRENTTLVWVL